MATWKDVRETLKELKQAVEEMRKASKALLKEVSKPWIVRDREKYDFNKRPDGCVLKELMLTEDCRMTVKELKEKLENVQDDAKVMLIDMDSILQSGRYEVEDIRIENEGKTVLIM